MVRSSSQSRPWRRYEIVIARLALQVLRDAASKSTRGPVRTVEVRLALHALRPILRGSELLVRYWDAARNSGNHPWESCHRPCSAIEAELTRLGVPIDGG